MKTFFPPVWHLWMCLLVVGYAPALGHSLLLGNGLPLATKGRNWMTWITLLRLACSLASLWFL